MKQQTSGFTLVELLVIVSILSILATIAAPAWLNLITRQRLYDARANALDKIREAQSQALRTSRLWEACFRDANGMVEVSVQPSGLANNCQRHKNWTPLLEVNSNAIAIAPQTSKSLGNATTGYSFRFNLYGDRIGFESDDDDEDAGQHLVLQPRNQNSPLYCIASRNIIGAVEEGKFDVKNNICH